MTMDEREFELIDYLRVLWRWRWLIGAGTLAGVLGAFVVTWWQPRVYAVSAIVEVGDLGEDPGQTVERLVARYAAPVYYDDAGRPAPGGSVAIGVEYRKPVAVLVRSDTQDPARAAAVVQKVAAALAEEVGRALQAREAEDDARLKDLQQKIEAVQREAEMVVIQLRALVEHWVRIGRGQVATTRGGADRARQERDLTQRYVETLRRNLDELRRARAEAARGGGDPGRVLVFSQLSTEIVLRENELTKYEQDLVQRFPAMIQELEAKEQAARDQLTGLETLRAALAGRRATTGDEVETLRSAFARAAMAGVVDLRTAEMQFQRLSADLPEQARAFKRDADRLTRRMTATQPVRVAAIDVLKTPIRSRLRLNLAVGLVLGLFGSVLLAFAVEYVRRARPRPAGPLP